MVLTFRLVITLAGLLILSVQDRQAGPSLSRIVSIIGEHGVVAVEGNVVSLFADKVSLRVGRSESWSEATLNGGSLTVQLNGPTYRLLSTQLKRLAADVPALCDERDQIDLRSADGSLQAAVPQGRVKALRSVLPAHLDLIVFTKGFDGMSSAVGVALLREDPRSRYVLEAADEFAEGARFCGLKQIGDREFLVLTEEPAGSSVSLGLYAYHVR